LVYTPNVFTATIELEGKTYAAILQDIQFHPVTDAILHIDFYQIFDDKEVTMNIPVQLEGSAPGVMNGGSLRFTNRKLKIKAIPANLPDFLTANISELKIGDKLQVAELATEGLTVLHPETMVVVQVRTSRNTTEDEEVEGEEGEAEATEETAAE